MELQDPSSRLKSAFRGGLQLWNPLATLTGNKVLMGLIPKHPPQVKAKETFGSKAKDELSLTNVLTLNTYIENLNDWKKILIRKKNSMMRLVAGKVAKHLLRAGRGAKLLALYLCLLLNLKPSCQMTVAPVWKWAVDKSYNFPQISWLVSKSQAAWLYRPCSEVTFISCWAQS